MNQQPAQFIVRMPRASYAFRFHENFCGPQHEPVADREATTFTDQIEADQTALKHGLRAGQYEICEYNPSTKP